MVAGGQGGGKRGFSAEKSTVEPTKLTLEEFDKFAGIITKLISDSGIRWAIIAAGIGAIFETVHIIWLALRWFLKF